MFLDSHARDLGQKPNDWKEWHYRSGKVNKLYRFSVLHDFDSATCTCSCVEWGSTNTGWHINAHYVKKLYTHEVKLNIMGIWEWGIYGLMGGAFMAYNGWGIYDLRVWIWLKWWGSYDN